MRLVLAFLALRAAAASPRRGRLAVACATTACVRAGDAGGRCSCATSTCR